MKVHALLASAVLLASPAVFAQQDLCQTNLQEIDDNMATNTATLGEPAKSKVEEYVQQARQAQQSGDTEACIAHSTGPARTQGPRQLRQRRHRRLRLGRRQLSQGGGIVPAILPKLIIF